MQTFFGNAMRRLLFFALLFPALGAGAAEFRSVDDAAAVLYDGPSLAAIPVYVVSHAYPLEVIVSLESWVKVRDHTGTLAWIEKSSLSDRRTVLVTSQAATVRVRPDDAAPVAFVAAQDVVLDWVEDAPGGWVQVRHADGTSGFVRSNQVWGG